MDEPIGTPPNADSQAATEPTPQTGTDTPKVDQSRSADDKVKADKED